MNKPYNKQKWYLELDSHIKCVYNVSKQRKTILITGDHFYIVVTRVNYLTTTLWINHVNSIIKELGTDRIELQRFGWLVEQKSYRRDFMVKLSTLTQQ